MYKMTVDANGWRIFFEKAGIPNTVAKDYAAIFAKNRITKDVLPDLDREILKELGINVIGDILLILKYCKNANEHIFQNEVQSAVSSTTSSLKEANKESVTKLPPPQIAMIKPKFDSSRLALSRSESALTLRTGSKRKGHPVDMDVSEDDDVQVISPSKRSNVNSTVFKRLGNGEKATSSAVDMIRPKSPEQINALKRLVSHTLLSNKHSAHEKRSDVPLQTRLGRKDSDSISSRNLEYQGVLKRISDPITKSKVTSTTFAMTNEVTSSYSAKKISGGIFDRHVEKHVKNRLG